MTLGGCAARATPSASTHDSVTSAGSETSPSSSSRAPDEHVADARDSLVPRTPGPLTRAEVETALTRGLGVFLARVDVSPAMTNGRFVGFRLERADDIDDWHSAGADIRIGDVILRVNGIRIERPEQALWAFERLRIARAIDVDLIRNGAPRTISTPIVDLVAQQSARVSSP